MSTLNSTESSGWLREHGLIHGMWTNPGIAALAALCHAVYGTDGIDRSLLDRSDRRSLAALIGDEGMTPPGPPTGSDQPVDGPTSTRGFTPDSTNFSPGPAGRT